MSIDSNDISKKPSIDTDWLFSFVKQVATKVDFYNKELTNYLEQLEGVTKPQQNAEVVEKVESLLRTLKKLWNNQSSAKEPLSEVQIAQEVWQAHCKRIPVPTFLFWPLLKPSEKVRLILFVDKIIWYIRNGFSEKTFFVNERDIFTYGNDLTELSWLALSIMFNKVREILGLEQKSFVPFEKGDSDILFLKDA